VFAGDRRYAAAERDEWTVTLCSGRHRLTAAGRSIAEVYETQYISFSERISRTLR